MRHTSPYTSKLLLWLGVRQLHTKPVGPHRFPSIPVYKALIWSVQTIHVCTHAGALFIRVQSEAAVLQLGVGEDNNWKKKEA